MFKDKRSIENLAGSHPDLQALFNKVSSYADCIVICGYRDKKSQNKANEEGFSGKRYPNSKHNKRPSLAVDVIPKPVNWKDLESFKKLGFLVKEIAREMKIAIEWGGDWVSRKDYPHYQLKRQPKKD